MNIYDEKRRSAVIAHCGVDLVTPVERVIQLEDERDVREARIAELESELGEYKARNPYNIIADRDARIAKLEAALRKIKRAPPAWARAANRILRQIAKEALDE